MCDVKSLQCTVNQCLLSKAISLVYSVNCLGYSQCTLIFKTSVLKCESIPNLRV